MPCSQLQITHLVRCPIDAPEAVSRAPWYQFRYQQWYYLGMPSLNVTFTEEELASVRAAAASDDVSLRAFAHRAILAAASEHRRRVAEAARLVAERSAELNRRLA